MYTYDLYIIKDQIQPTEIRGGTSSFEHLRASLRLILCPPKSFYDPSLSD